MNLFAFRLIHEIFYSIIKNKTGDSSSINNNRHIALVTPMSKQISLYLFLEPYLETTYNQFANMYYGRDDKT